MKSQDEKIIKAKLLDLARYYARMLTDLCSIPTQVIEYYDGPDMKMCEKGCAFCEWMEKNASPQIDCRLSVTEAGQRAIRCGGRYIFYCKSGFIHFVAPIKYLDDHIATLVGGPIQLCNRDSLLVDAIMSNMKLDQEYRNEVIKRLIDIPQLSPYKLGKATEIYAAVASHVCRIGDAKMERNTMTEDNNFWMLCDLELNLLKKISDSKKEETKRALVDFEKRLDTFLQMDLDVGKNLVLTYAASLARIYVDHHHSNYMDIETDFGLEYINQIHASTSIEEVEEHLHEYGEEFLHKVFMKEKIVHNTVISSVIDYVNQNYMNKITLESTAEHAFLSASYLSKIFKEEVGCNFNTFVNKLRIDKAKKLLTDDNINIVEVANLVGYEDQSYFSKVFRRITGTTPKKYKDNKLFQ